MITAPIWIDIISNFICSKEFIETIYNIKLLFCGFGLVLALSSGDCSYNTLSRQFCVKRWDVPPRWYCYLHADKIIAGYVYGMKVQCSMPNLRWSIIIILLTNMFLSMYMSDVCNYTFTIHFEPHPCHVVYYRHKNKKLNKSNRAHIICDNIYIVNIILYLL